MGNNNFLSESNSQQFDYLSPSIQLNHMLQVY